MKALSLRQPYAWLVVNGWKLVENRTWKTNHRGPLLIHASQKIDLEAMEDLSSYLRSMGEEPPASLHWTGGIVGMVDLVDCQTGPDRLNHDQLQDYTPGCIAWVLDNAIACELIPYSGKLHLFDVPDELIA